MSLSSNPEKRENQKLFGASHHPNSLLARAGRDKRMKAAYEQWRRDWSAELAARERNLISLGVERGSGKAI